MADAALRTCNLALTVQLVGTQCAESVTTGQRARPPLSVVKGLVAHWTVQGIVALKQKGRVV